MRHQRAAVRLVLALAVACAATAPAAAAPTVSIKARTELHLGPVRKDYDGNYVVTGQLVDRNTGAGLAGQRVTAHVGDEAITVTTDSDGNFEASLDADGGEQDVAVDFPGGGALDAARIRLDDVDVDKAAVELQLDVRPVTGGVQIAVEAVAGDVKVNVPVDLRVGPADADPLPQAGRVTSGGPPLTLRRVDAGGPGRKRVRAAFAGDALHAPATADASFEMTAETAVTLAVADDTLAYEDDVRASGRVVDEDGRAVAGAVVAIVAGDRRISQAVAAADGSFRVGFEAEVLGPGRTGLQAVVETTDAWLKGSRSKPVMVTVARPQPVPIAYTMAAFLATALCAAGFFAARSRPWQRLQRRHEPPAVRTEPGGEPAGGVSLARPSLVSTLRRPYDSGLAGGVRDSVRGRPVPGAIVDLVLGGDRRTIRVAADGSFAAEDLGAGVWHVAVTAPGHVTERFDATLPHRGELRGLRVDLVPVRERVFQLYRRAAHPLLPDPALWGIWSPRQIVDHVRSRRPTPALADLTDFVEEVYFSARVPVEPILADATRRVDAAVAEQAALRS